MLYGMAHLRFARLAALAASALLVWSGCGDGGGEDNNLINVGGGSGGGGGGGGGAGGVIGVGGGGGEPDAGPDGGGFACQPGKRYCIDLYTSAICNSKGDGPTNETPCKGETLCDDDDGKCHEPYCKPGHHQCTTPTTYRTCDEIGSGWSDDVACPEEHFCTNLGDLGAECYYRRCLGNVVLMVDRSGSMFDDWSTLQNSVGKVLESNPKALFGLVGFPIPGTPCGTKGDLDVAMQPNNTFDFTAYFGGSQPWGATPLAAAMQAFEAQADQIFGEDGGTLIVFSDGADTCAYPELEGDPVAREAAIEADLSASAAKLFLDHDVQTYVIGYNYDGNPGELNAIAASGGTPLTQYISVGSESELDNAFSGIVKDFKLCF